MKTFFAARAASAMLGIVTLAACGFSPVYAPTQSAGPGIAGLGPVAVPVIEGRAGDQLRLALLRQLGAPSAGASASTLSINLRENLRRFNVGLDQSTGRAELTLTADYVLRGVDGALIAEGSEVAIAAFDNALGAFTDLPAQEDAQERAATLLAQRLRLAIAAAAKRQG